jgi:hypothetical protein
MATLYRATDPRTGNEVALTQMEMSDAEAAPFQLEVEILATFKCPTLLLLIGYSISDSGDVGIVTPFPSRGSLQICAMRVRKGIAQPVGIPRTILVLPTSASRSLSIRGARCRSREEWVGPVIWHLNRYRGTVAIPG